MVRIVESREMLVEVGSDGGERRGVSVFTIVTGLIRSNTWLNLSSR